MELEDLKKTKVGQLPVNQDILRKQTRLSTEHRLWTERELEIIKSVSADPKVPVNITLLSKALNRTYASVALCISRLGLGSRTRASSIETVTKTSETKKRNWSLLSPSEKQEKVKHLMPFVGKTFKGKAHTEQTKRKLSEQHKQYWATHPHPKGMLGKHHSPETKSALSLKAKHYQDSLGAEERKRLSRLRYNKMVERGTHNKRPHGSWKCGWMEIGGQRFFARSLWEANYALYLEWLKSHGEITYWKHEPETFWFTGIKRGCVSYLPDFKVIQWSGEVEYHEIKGWMDKRSRTKIRRMAKYFPKITLIVIDAARYKCIAAKARKLIPGWQ